MPKRSKKACPTLLPHLDIRTGFLRGLLARQISLFEPGTNSTKRLKARYGGPQLPHFIKIHKPCLFYIH